MPPRPFGDSPDILANLVRQQPLIQQAELRIRQAQNEQTRQNLLSQFLGQADLSKLKPSDFMTKVAAIVQDPNIAVNAVKLRVGEELRGDSLAKRSILGQLIGELSPEGLTQEEGTQIRAAEQSLGVEKQTNLGGLIQQPRSRFGRQRTKVRLDENQKPKLVRIGNAFRVVEDILDENDQPTGDIKLGAGGVVSVSSFGDKRIQDLQQRFNSDKVVVKASERMASAKNMKELLDSDNPAADTAMPFFAARASGEVGALTATDLKAFGGSRAIKDRLRQIITTAATGKLTAENRSYIRRLADAFERAAFADIEKRARIRAKQGASTSSFPEEQIFNAMFPDGAFKRGTVLDPEKENPGAQSQVESESLEDLLSRDLTEGF